MTEPETSRRDLLKIQGYAPFTSGAKCRKCGSLDRWWIAVGDGTYEDYRYTCADCGDSYIVEGPDS